MEPSKVHFKEMKSAIFSHLLLLDQKFLIGEADLAMVMLGHELMIYLSIYLSQITIKSELHLK